MTDRTKREKRRKEGEDHCTWFEWLAKSSTKEDEEQDRRMRMATSRSKFGVFFYFKSFNFIKFRLILKSEKKKGIL